MKVLFFIFLCCISTQLYAQKTINTRPDQVTEAVRPGTVVFVDHSLNHKKGKNKFIRISAEKHGAKILPSSYLSAWVLFRNHTDFDYILEVRASFFEESGIPSSDRSRWKRVYVAANSAVKFSEISVDKNSRNYRFEVRSLK